MLVLSRLEAWAVKKNADNPRSPFAARYCEWFRPQPAPVEVIEERAKSLLTCNDSPDIPYTWSVNPYRGCQHGCSYCYARRTHEYLDLGAGSDFEIRIVVKVNAPELLSAELSRPSWQREQIAFSGVTDCYQPLEVRYRLTRQCLEVCARHANPVGIVTKSYLVTRDADLLAEIDRRASAQVVFSLTFADDERARLIEPSAPPPSKRFEALRQLRAARVPVGVLIAPVIPGLNDREIPAILARAAECGASVVSYSPVRLPGNVGPVFLARLRQELPEAARRVEARIRDLRGGLLNDPRFGHRMEAHGAYWDGVARLFETTATRLGLDCGQRWRKPVCRGSNCRPKQLPLF